MNNPYPLFDCDISGTYLDRSANYTTQHDSSKRNTLSIGRSDGSNDTINNTFTGWKCIVNDGSTEGLTANQTLISAFTWENSIATSREVLRIDSFGRLRLSNDVWHMSLGDSKNRLYYANNSRTFFGPGDGTFEWRSTTNTATLNLENYGSLTAQQDIVAKGYFCVGYYEAGKTVDGVYGCYIDTNQFWGVYGFCYLNCAIKVVMTNGTKYLWSGRITVGDSGGVLSFNADYTSGTLTIVNYWDLIGGN